MSAQVCWAQLQYMKRQCTTVHSRTIKNHRHPDPRQQGGPKRTMPEGGVSKTRGASSKYRAPAAPKSVAASTTTCQTSCIDLNKRTCERDSVRGGRGEIEVLDPQRRGNGTAERTVVRGEGGQIPAHSSGRP